MATSFATGEIIQDKYRIERVLGEGAMGVVVAAHHLGLDRRVAIKFLKEDLTADPACLERFSREARAASKIDSEHVARILDVDALADGTPFMVMEYLEGSDLARFAAGGVALGVAEVVEYVVAACRGLQEAHRLGIVHRDIKPANLFLAATDRGSSRIKVLDFGISRLSHPQGKGEVRLTQSNAALGSPAYMAPEQMLDTQEADARADIWALGVTMYELLTTQLPFPGATYQQLTAQVLAGKPKPPSHHRPGLPRGLDAVVLRCLERDVEKRFQTADDLATALLPYSGAPPGPGPRRPTFVVLAAAAVLMVAALSVLLGLGPRRVDRSQGEPSRTLQPAEPAARAEAPWSATSGSLAPPLPDGRGAGSGSVAAGGDVSAAAPAMTPSIASSFPSSAAVGGKPATMGGGPASPPARPVRPPPHALRPPRETHTIE